MTTAPTASTPTRADRDRRARIDLIRNGARVRRLLGQGALYCVLPDGQHELTFGGQRFVGATLQEAVDLCSWAHDHSGASPPMA